MSESDITAWIARYEQAWASNEPDDVRALFTPDAEYRTAPFREPHVGQDAIVEFWLSHRDDGDWSFRWHPLGRDGDTVFVQGETDYPSEGRYSNLWVIELAADGRASAFTEWWMKTAG